MVAKAGVWVWIWGLQLSVVSASALPIDRRPEKQLLRRLQTQNSFSFNVLSLNLVNAPVNF
jgi:hypothetical protein